MFCAKCGYELPEDALFCGKCGNKVEVPDDIKAGQQGSAPAGQRPPEQQKATVPAEQKPSEQQRVVVPAGQKPPEQKMVVPAGQQLGPYQPPVQPGNARAKEKPIPLIQKVLVLEAVLFVVLAVVCFLKVRECASPETVAKSYFIAVMAGDEKKAYDLIDVDESEFVNEKYFGELLKNIGQKNVYNYTIDDKEDGGESDRDFKKRVKITYRLKEDTSDYSFEVELEKSSSKRFFILDEWKVNVGDFIQKDVTLYVNKGSKVKIDGAELNEKYLSAAESEEEDLKYDRYVIPKMFCGTYETLITHDIYADYKMPLAVSEDSETVYEGEDEEDGVAVKQEIVEKVAKQSQEDFKALWNGAVQQKSFGSMGSIPMMEDSSEIKEEYEELAKKFKREDGAGLQNMSFGNFEVAAEVEEDGDLSSPAINVNFSSSFSCTSLNRSWWSGELESRDSSGDYSGKLNYTYQNGKWVLYDMSLSSFYY